jgi:hypothetical protein
LVILPSEFDAEAATEIDEALTEAGLQVQVRRRTVTRDPSGLLVIVLILAAKGAASAGGGLVFVTAVGKIRAYLRRRRRQNRDEPPAELVIQDSDTETRFEVGDDTPAEAVDLMIERWRKGELAEGGVYHYDAAVNTWQRSKP